MLSFNFTAIIVFLSFLVFMFLMKAIFFDPLARIRQEREAKLEADRQAAKAALLQQDKLQLDYEESLKQARRQAQEVVNSLRQQAKKSAADTLANAREEARNELDKRLQDLAQWREETYQQLGNERRQLVEIILGKVSHKSAVSLNSH